MCQWKFLVFRYSANASARSTLSASETLVTAWGDRSVGVSRSGETLLGALLTGNLPVRTRTLTARRRTPNARRERRFPSRNLLPGPFEITMNDWIDYYDSTHTIYVSK